MPHADAPADGLPLAPLHPPPARQRARGLVALALIGLVALVLSSDRVHGALLDLLARAEPVIAEHPIVGAAVFVLLSAVSALLAFFSALPLVPVASYTWGEGATMVLLWLGWLLGGSCAYAIGASLGRPLLSGARALRLLDFYRSRIPHHASFSLVLLVQLALPSEIPGYLFGLLRLRFATYLAALAIAEIPYAVGTVLAGESVLRQSGWGLLALAAAGFGLSLYAMLLVRRRLRQGDRHANGEDEQEPPASRPTK